MRFFKALFLVTTILTLMACSNMRTQNQYNQALVDSLKVQNYDGAVNIIEQNKEKRFTEKDRVLYYLYLGVLQHYQQDYANSNMNLTTAENQIEELYTESISKATSSFLLNDNTLAYAGEDYEDIYINIFKSLNYIALKKDNSAFVEIRKVNEKLELLEDKYKKYAKELNKSDDAKIRIEVGNVKFNNSALARYLSMLLYKADGQLDDAQIDKRYIDEAFKLQSNIYNFDKPEVSTNFLSKKGTVKLNVVSFIGRAPTKTSVDYRIATGDNQLVIYRTDENATDGQYFPFPGVKSGYFFKFSVPKMTKTRSEIDKIVVEVDNKVVGNLQKIEDMNSIAGVTFEQKAKMAYVRAITRTAIKGIAAIVIKEKIEKKTNELGGFLAQIAAAAATEATEAADLRSCIAFPGSAFVGDFNIAPGIHNITVKYINKFGVEISRESKQNYLVEEEGLNIIESFLLR